LVQFDNIIFLFRPSGQIDDIQSDSASKDVIDSTTGVSEYDSTIAIFDRTKLDATFAIQQVL